MDNINFTGGFLLRKPTSEMWKKVYNEAVPRSNRIIINNLYKDGNVFFATKESQDSKILKYLLNVKALKFTYYPNIGIKDRLDIYSPAEAVNLLNREISLSDKTKIRKYLKTETEINPITGRKYKWEPNDHIEQTFKALKLNTQNYNVKTENHVTYIYDKNGKMVVKTSPNTNTGINYAFVYPHYSDEKLLMVVINDEGKIFTKSSDIDSFGKFYEDFSKAVKIDAERTRLKKKS